MQNSIPRLITAGVIAQRLKVPLSRIQHILATRPHIRPAALAGRVRLYASIAVAQVRYQLSLIDARRSSTTGRKCQ